MLKNHLFIVAFCISSIFSFSQQDPYLWLEEVESERSMEWVKTQNKLSANRIGGVEGFEDLKSAFLESMNDEEKIDYPSVIGDYVYNFWKDEKHIRGIWRRTTKSSYMSNTAEWETVLDFDELSEQDGAKWVFHGVEWFAPDNKICLVEMSDGGTDEGIVREFDTETKQFVVNGFELASSKGSAIWLNEDELMISRNFGENTLTSSGYPFIVKRWKRGEKIENAETVFNGGEDIMGAWPFGIYVDGVHHICLQVSESFYSGDLYYWQNEKLIKLDLPKDCNVNDLYQNNLLVSLDSDWEVSGESFKLGDLISLDLNKLIQGTHDAKLVFRPDAKTSIEGVAVIKGGVLLNCIENVKSKVFMATLTPAGWTTRPVNTPQFGRISIIDYDRTENGFFFQYSNFITPPTLYHQNGSKTIKVRQGKAKFNADNLAVHQYEVKSKDGTTIPYFIVHKKDMKLDGTNPTLVYAYGGFNVSSKPSYRANVGIGWLEQGGVYVLANIRGGGEFGPAWHQAALKENRQNAYDDFYAITEDLMKKNITSPRHCGAFGWSNGGLMAGVVATQRPDLFNAVIIGAPLLDMKRYNKLLAGASWMAEYGNPDIDEEWEYIKKYSPYHNVFEGRDYPEVFLITSTKDDRVHPAHARKMAARMIEQGHPILFYETIEGGHGASSTNEQAAFNSAMMFSYLKMKLK
ncbi:MAG: prolyl oligopeptidase family serine peptidase [Crocinitomicaceae bacterium]|nr:prolyl oligopeptidase family serine peptidase [Crocinitomicaceae bacterium]